MHADHVITSTAHQFAKARRHAAHRPAWAASCSPAALHCSAPDAAVWVTFWICEMPVEIWEMPRACSSAPWLICSISDCDLAASPVTRPIASATSSTSLRASEELSIDSRIRPAVSRAACAHR
jgi:hypothetical protein